MNPLLIAVLVSVGAIVLVVAVAVMTRMRGSEPGGMAPEVASMVDDARHDPGERPASLVAEQVESVVQQKLGDYLTRSGIKLDFGNLADGSLGIWVNDTQYTRIDDVPDATIREAIRSAVQEFNQ